MSTETELKYHVDEALTQNLLSQRCLGYFELSPFRIREVTDVYYDTPDRRVAQAGWALRFRRQEGRGFLELKSLTPAAGAWHERQELRIDTEHPTEPDRWPQTPEAAFLREIIGDQPLESLFTLHQTRHEAQLLDGSDKPFALLSLDKVHWQAGERQAQAWELEIELREGVSPARLVALADYLKSMPGLKPQTVSKYERGLALLKSLRPSRTNELAASKSD